MNIFTIANRAALSLLAVAAIFAAASPVAFAQVPEQDAPIVEVCTDEAASNFEAEAPCEYPETPTVEDTIARFTHKERNWCEPEGDAVVPVELCKFDVTDSKEDPAAVSGWFMTLTSELTDEVADGETGNDGCITFYVDPADGPWIAVEDDQADWMQNYVYVSGGISYPLENDAYVCELFVDAYDENVDYRCDFFNEIIDEGGDGGGNNGTSTDRFTLTVSITGDGSGSVVSGDGLINCVSGAVESDCSETYDASTTVDLIATPNEGSNFDSSWTAGFGTCTASSTPCQLVMTQDVALVAHFGLNAATTTTTGGGHGGGRSGGTRVNRDSDDSDDSDTPEGEVLGEQVSVVPAGAPDTGAGGTASGFICAPYCAAATTKRFFTSIR